MLFWRYLFKVSLVNWSYRQVTISIETWRKTQEKEIAWLVGKEICLKGNLKIGVRYILTYVGSDYE